LPNGNIQNIDWGVITNTIKEEKCILFIGPEIFKNENGLTLEEQIFEYLEVENNRNIQNFYMDDGLFLFTSRTSKTFTSYKIKDFYDQDFTNAQGIIQKLVKIPFHLIITVTPDKKFQQAFEAMNYQSRHLTYAKNQTSKKETIKPTAINPVVYSMFGKIDDQNSMILTHDDLFDYFESIFQENSMPEKLRLTIKEAHNFIFLGLDFEKWYMQILLRILYMHNDNYDFLRYAANQNISEELKSFCHQQFKIEFVPNRISEFVDELFYQCDKLGLLRKESIRDIVLIEKIKNMIGDNQIEKALEETKKLLDRSYKYEQELQAAFLNIKADFKELNQEMIVGVLNPDQYKIRKAQIVKSLILLLDQLKNGE